MHCNRPDMRLLFLCVAILLRCYPVSGAKDDEVLESQVQNLTDQVQTLRDQVQILTDAVGKMQAMVAKMDLPVKDRETAQVSNQEYTGERPVIAFCAVKTATQQALAWDNILFDEVQLDTHGSYYPGLGVYFIPEAGIYEVIVTVFKGMSPVYNGAYADLYSGDTFLARVYHWLGYDTSSTASGTASVILRFRAGDALRVVSRYRDTYYASPRMKASQFSAKYLGPAPKE